MVDERRAISRDIGERVVALETQMTHFISDAVEEKETRRRSSAAMFDRFDTFDERMRALERTIWTAGGATGVVVGVVVFLVNFFVSRHA